MPDSTLPIISFDPEAYDSLGGVLDRLSGYVAELFYHGAESPTVVLLEPTSDFGASLRARHLSADGFPQGDAFDVDFTALREVRIP